MGRPRPTDTTELGTDSFLDVMANMVGILIILVVIVGVRVKDGPRSEPPATPAPEPIATPAPVVPRDPPPPEIDLETPQQTLQTLAQQLAQQTQQISGVNIDLQTAHQQASLLEKTVQERQQLLDLQRNNMQAADRQALELKGRTRFAQEKLAELEQQLAEVDRKPKPQVKVENFPTPISQSTAGEQLHFQVKDGRVAPIPLQALMEEVEQTVRQEANRLRQQRKIVITTNPIGEFRLIYEVEKQETSLQDQLLIGRPGMELEESWHVEPVARPVGEPVERALMPGSQFRSLLDQLNPKQTTITLWVYPNSFTAYRQLKRELYQLGFATAGRPLPEGVSIAGSPRGSRSAAQ